MHPPFIWALPPLTSGLKDRVRLLAKKPLPLLRAKVFF